MEHGLSNPFPGTMDPLLLKDFPEHCQFICMEIGRKNFRKKSGLKRFWPLMRKGNILGNGGRGRETFQEKVVLKEFGP